ARLARSRREVHRQGFLGTEREPDGIHEDAGLPGRERSRLLVRGSERELTRPGLTNLPIDELTNWIITSNNGDPTIRRFSNPQISRGVKYESPICLHRCCCVHR